MPSQQFALQISPEQAPQLPQLPQVQEALQVRLPSCEPGGQLPQLRLVSWVAPGLQPALQLPKFPHAPQPQLPLQVRVRDCVPELQLQVAFSVSTWFGAQAPAPLQPPHAPHALQAHEAVQVRARDCIPWLQLPQAWLSVPVLPAVQPVSPAQPPHAPQVPQEQSMPHARLRVFMPLLQLPQVCISLSVLFGMQPGAELQAPQALQASQAQAAPHVRVRVCSSPQTPQLSGSLSVSEAAHSPSSLHTSSSHWQVSRQVRDALPQLPHAPRSSFAPGEQTPSVWHSLGFSQMPSAPQCWVWVPQLPHFRLRSSPAVQLQSFGASHSAHAPITHC